MRASRNVGSASEFAEGRQNHLPARDYEARQAQRITSRSVKPRHRMEMARESRRALPERFHLLERKMPTVTARIDSGRFDDFKAAVCQPGAG